MERNNTDIEVEVIEIDGVKPAASSEPLPRNGPSSSDWQDWRTWRGRVTSLNSRWWPLWVVLGIIATALLLTVGVVVGIVVIIVRLVLRLVRAIIGHPAVN